MQLVKASQQGDQDAFALLVQKHQRRVFNVILRMVHDYDDASDVTATMNGHRVLVKYRGRVAPFSIAVPREADADAIAAELRSLGHDVALHDALASLARRFTSSRSV